MSRVRYPLPEAMLIRLFAFWFALGLALASPLSAGDSSPELSDVEGRPHRPLTVAQGLKGTVLVFVSPYCPTANKFLPEVNRIATGHGSMFSFYLIHSDKDTKVTDAYQQAVLNEVKLPVLMDTDQALAKKLQAKTTPECVVLSPSGAVMYQGRINDLYLGPTKRQRQATTSELVDALEAMAAGKPVATPRTEAVGCKIGGLP